MPLYPFLRYLSQNFTSDAGGANATRTVALRQRTDYANRWQLLASNPNQRREYLRHCVSYIVAGTDAQDARVHAVVIAPRRRMTTRYAFALSPQEFADMVKYGKEIHRLIS